MEISTVKKSYSRFGLVYTVMFWALAILFVLGEQIVKLVSGQPLAGQAAIIYEYALRLVLVYPLMYVLVKKLPMHEIKKNKLGVGGFLACVAISYTIMYFSNIVGLIINSSIGKLTGLGGVNPLANVYDALNPAVQVIIVAVLAPICEELLFRKILIDRVVGFGEVLAMLMSGFMFGLYHGNLAQFVYAFTLGCFFAFIYIRTGKVWYTIVIHLIINGFSTILSDFVMKDVNVAELSGYLTNGDLEGYNAFVQENLSGLALMGVFNFIVIATIIAGIILMIVLRKKFVFEHRDGEVEKGQRFNAAILNPGMILYVVYFIATIVLTQFGQNLISILCNAFGIEI